MNWAIISILIMFIGYIIWSTRYLEKNLPIRDKRIKNKWEKEERNKRIDEKVKKGKEQKAKDKIKKDERNKQQKINIENGKRYEEYIANIYKNINYIIWEHGKEKGLKDKNIDIIAMNKEEVLFIQCKFYLKSKADHNMVKATRMDIIEYMREKKELTKLISGRKKKIIYVVPKESSLTPGAKKYISETNGLMEYKIIPMYL